MKNIVHIVGTGTIGEPLIGLFTDFKQHLGIDEVTFHKRTPMKTERAKVAHLMSRGAHLATEEDKAATSRRSATRSRYSAQEALERATVVMDCTPAGNENKEDYYKRLKGPVGFLAQGSEFGFGKMYARGINDSALVPGEDKFPPDRLVQHAQSRDPHQDARHDEAATSDGPRAVRLHAPRERHLPDEGLHPRADLREARRREVRDAPRARRLPSVRDARPGAQGLLVGPEAQHAVHALRVVQLRAQKPTDKKTVIEHLKENPLVALTERKSANEVFSFGRDHGYYGRILSQTVISTPTLAVADKGREIVGFCFTPQDGNSLLSSVAGAIWLMDPTTPRADSGPQAVRVSGDLGGRGRDRRRR